MTKLFHSLSGLELFLCKDSIILPETEINPSAYSSVIRQVFSFQNNPKNLNLSYKTDLDLWDCLGMVLISQQNFIGLI